MNDILVTNNKHLGAMVAGMVYGAKCGAKMYNIVVADISLETAKELEIGGPANSYMCRGSFSAKDSKFANLMEYANNPENQYDITECILSYDFSPFVLYLCRRDNEWAIVKTNKNKSITSRVSEFMEAKGFKIEMIETVTEKSKMAFLSIYNRFTGKETESNPGYSIISKDAATFIRNWNK